MLNKLDLHLAAIETAKKIVAQTSEPRRLETVLADFRALSVDESYWDYFNRTAFEESYRFTFLKSQSLAAPKPASADMAQRILGVFIAAILLALAPAAHAGFWLSFNTIAGTNSGALYGITNSGYLPIPSDTITVTNIQTNDQITLTYGYQPSGQSGTNPVALASITTNFNASTGWTNFPATWTYVVPANNLTAPVAAWGTVGFSSNGIAPPNNHTIGINW